MCFMASQFFSQAGLDLEENELAEATEHAEEVRVVLHLPVLAPHGFDELRGGRERGRGRVRECVAERECRCLRV